MAIEDIGDFSKVTFVNGTSPTTPTNPGDPPINATNLNALENRVQDIDDAISAGGSGTLTKVWTDVNGVTSGTYTPTLTNVTNVAASTAAPCQYMRVGDVVTVAGRVDIDLTSGTTASELGVTLPIASNFALSYQAAGDCVASDGAGIWSISADVTNNRASFQTSTVAATVNTTYYFTFTYRIL